MSVEEENAVRSLPKSENRGCFKETANKSRLMPPQQQCTLGELFRLRLAIHYEGSAILATGEKMNCAYFALSHGDLSIEVRIL